MVGKYLYIFLFLYILLFCKMNCFINACSYCERKIKRSFFDCKNDLTLKLKVKCKKNIFNEDNIYFTVIKKSPFAEEHQPFFFDKNKKIMSPYYKDLSDEIVNDDSLYFKINELKSKVEFLVKKVDTNRFIFKVGNEGEESGGGTNGIPYFIYVEDGGLNYLFKKITKEEDKNTLFGEKYFRIEKSEKSKNLDTIPITKLNGLDPT